MQELRRQTGSLRIGAAEVLLKHRWNTKEEAPRNSDCGLTCLKGVSPPVLIHKNGSMKI